MVAKKSRSESGEGTADPAHVESTRVEQEDGDFLCIMWHGNGYKRADSWLRSEEAYVIDLEDAE